MKNKHLKLIASLFSVFALASCGDKTTSEVTEGSTTKDTISEFQSISANITHDKQYFALSDYNVNLYMGGDASRKIDVFSIPSGLSVNGLTFSSNDESVATVSADGTITAVAKGFTTVNVSANNGEINEIVNVSVNESIDKSTAAERFNALNAATKDPEYVGIERFYNHELTTQTLSADGVIYNSAQYVQDMKFSKDEVYFEIYSDDLYLKTPDGNKEYSNGKWIFYLDTESYSLFLCHETAYSKNYMEVNCSAYLDDIGQGLMQEYEIIYELLDMFFVSGRKIITQSIDDIEGGINGSGTGMSTYENMSDMLTSSYTNVTISAGSPDGEDIHCKYSAHYDEQTIADDEEADLCIPARTPAPTVLDDEIFVKDGLVIGENYCVTMTYQIDIGNGMQDGERHFSKLNQNFTDFEIKKPDLKQYSLVDSIAKL